MRVVIERVERSFEPCVNKKSVRPGLMQVSRTFSHWSFRWSG